MGRYLASLGLCSLLWSGAGNTSSAELARAELPADILNDCPAVAVTSGDTACGDSDYLIVWFGRTPRGDLFLVRRDVCHAEGCRAWLVARDDSQATRTLLSVTGELRLERQGHFPVVRTRTELATHYTRYSRFEWTGDRYTRTETRLVYRIDDFECADENECRAAAQEALRRDQSDRAVRIWEQLYGVSWI